MGTTWAANTWAANAWGANTWADAAEQTEPGREVCLTGSDRSVASLTGSDRSVATLTGNAADC